MSSTVIIGFDESGKALEDELGSVPNSWRGAPAVWQYMEETYLPPYFPEWVDEAERAMGAEAFFERHRYKPSRISSFNPDALEEIVNLAYDKSVPEDERISLASTFDWVAVRREEIPRIIEAFRNFPARTSLPEQAAVLEEALDFPDLSAVGWIQTTVCCDLWQGEYDEETDESMPYDLAVNDDHVWLFDLLAKGRNCE